MVQTTLLFNALRQESYQAAKPRLLYRAQYNELANALVNNAINNALANNALDGNVSGAPSAQVTSSNVASNVASSNVASSNATSSNITSSNNASSTANPSASVGTVTGIAILITDGNTNSNSAESGAEHSDKNNDGHSLEHDLEQLAHLEHPHIFLLNDQTEQLALDPREHMTLYYSPALSYGMLGLAADQADDPWLERVVTVQLDTPLDVVRALVKVPSLLSDVNAALADNMRFALLESLLAAPPAISSVPERSGYLYLMNQLGCFQSAYERLESLCVGIAERLHTSVESQEILKTCLRYLADVGESNHNTQPALNISVGQGAAAVSLAAMVALVSDYVRQANTGDKALLLLREHVRTRYPLTAFQALGQYERDIITDADQATLSGIVEGEDLFSVLQMAQSLSRSGTLLLEGLGTEQKRGWVALKSGQATGIETFGATGIEALLEIILWGTSQFSFFDATTVTAQPLNKGTNELLMNIAQYLDFISQLSERGFSLKATINTTQAGHPETFAEVFNALEQHSTLDELVAAGHSRTTLLPALAALSEAGWLEFAANQGDN